MDTCYNVDWTTEQTIVLRYTKQDLHRGLTGELLRLDPMYLYI